MKCEIQKQSKQKQRLLLFAWDLQEGQLCISIKRLFTSGRLASFLFVVRKITGPGTVRPYAVEALCSEPSFKSGVRSKSGRYLV